MQTNNGKVALTLWCVIAATIAITLIVR